MSDLSQTTHDLLNVIEHIEAATVEHYNDNAEARRIITFAFKNAATIGGVPGRPSPPSDLDDALTVIGAGAALKDWAIKNVVIPWGLDELKAAFENVIDHYWSAIGSDREMEEDEPTDNDGWLKIRAKFCLRVEKWALTNDRHPVRHHHIRMQPFGNGMVKCFNLFYVDMLRKEICPFEFAAKAVHVAYLQRRLFDPTCEHVIDALKMLRLKITEFRDRVTELMKSDAPEIRERIQLIPFEERTRYLTIDELTYYFNAVEARIQEHEADDSDSYEYDQNNEDVSNEPDVQIDNRDNSISIDGTSIPFKGMDAIWPIMRKLVENYHRDHTKFTTGYELTQINEIWTSKNVTANIRNLRKYLIGTRAKIDTGERGEGYRFKVVPQSIKRI